MWSKEKFQQIGIYFFIRAFISSFNNLSNFSGSHGLDDGKIRAKEGAHFISKEQHHDEIE